MLENGFGEHNIQGIGDKHIPLIHNVMNTDIVVGVSDRATDELNVLFNTAAGREYLVGRRGRARGRWSTRSTSFGLSSICNVLAAIKVARQRRGSGRTTSIVTVATDGAAMYGTERDKVLRARLRRRVRRGRPPARSSGGTCWAPATDARCSSCTERDRRRIFNLGYFTWVEQQGVPLDEFDGAARARRSGRSCARSLPVWDDADRRVQRRGRAARVPA